MCDKCGGTGIFRTADFVDYGSAVVRMEQSFTCDCLESCYCPSCDVPLNEVVIPETEDEDEQRFWHCPECGRRWNMDLVELSPG